MADTIQHIEQLSQLLQSASVRLPLDLERFVFYHLGQAARHAADDAAMIDYLRVCEQEHTLHAKASRLWYRFLAWGDRLAGEGCDK